MLAAAGLIACSSIGDAWLDLSDGTAAAWRKVVGTEPNPLLQSREGRMEIVSRCQTHAQARWPTARTVNFAEGRLTNVDADGDAKYLGAIEVISQGGLAQRFRFVCQVQPDGAVDLRFL